MGGPTLKKKKKHFWAARVPRVSGLRALRALRHEAGLWFNDGSRGSSDAGPGHDWHDGGTLLQIGAFGAS